MDLCISTPLELGEPQGTLGIFREPMGIFKEPYLLGGFLEEPLTAQLRGEVTGGTFNNSILLKGFLKDLFQN